MEVNYKRIGQHLQEARKLKGLTIDQVANQIRFTARSVAFAENGQAEMDIKFFLSLCNALDVTPNDLLEGQFTARNEKSLAEEKMLADMKELLQEMGGEEADSGDIVIKDTETVFQELRDFVREQAQGEKSSNQRVLLKSERIKAQNKGTTHW